MIDEILKKYDLTWEDLNNLEKATLNKWLRAIQVNQLTVDKVKDFVTTMRVSVEGELTAYDLGSRQDLYLKARLRNLVLLEGMLTSPDRAKEELERAIAGFGK